MKVPLQDDYIFYTDATKGGPLDISYVGIAKP